MPIYKYPAFSGLSVRARNAISSFNWEHPEQEICTFEELSQLSKLEVRQWRNIGDVTIQELEDALQERGLSFQHSVEILKSVI